MKLTNLIPTIIAFLADVRLEAKKVNWPSRERTVKDTILVIAFAVMVAAFLGLFDLFFTSVLNRIIAL